MLTSEQIISAIKKDKASSLKKKAKKGQAYYDARHDILDYRIFFINQDGKMQEDMIRSNNRVPHPFFTEIADQEVGYLLSGGLKLTSKYLELEEYLEEYFNDRYLDELSEIVLDTIVRGFGYIYWYKDVKGITRFSHADSLNVVEVKDGSSTDTTNDYIIRYYSVMAKDKAITRVEVWDKNFTYYYLYDGAGLTLDKNITFNPRPHILYQIRGKYYYEDYECIPFLRLDYNRKQVSGVYKVKPIMDDYDLMNCGLSNNLTDIQEGIYVVKGFKGANLDELVTNVKSKKIVGVSEKGDLDIKTVNIPYEARKAKMEEDEKNIYRFAQAFNSNQTGDGNITNVVIQSRYTLLDIKVNKLGIRVKDFLRRQLEIIVPEINERFGKSYTVEDIKIDFPKKIPSNVKEDAEIKKLDAETKQVKVNTARDAATVLDDETAIKEVCKALDIDPEQIIKNMQEEEIPKLAIAREVLLSEQISETG